MPRHLISDAHEWINEIPTVPPGSTKHWAISSSQLQFRSPSRLWLSELVSDSHLAMAGPSPHVPPHPLVPHSVPPLSSPSSCPDLTPRSATFPSSSLLRSSDNPRSEHSLPAPPHSSSDPLLHPPPATLPAQDSAFAPIYISTPLPSSDLTFTASDLTSSSVLAPDPAAASPSAGQFSSDHLSLSQFSRRRASKSGRLFRSSSLAAARPAAGSSTTLPSSDQLLPPLSPRHGALSSTRSSSSNAQLCPSSAELSVRPQSGQPEVALFSSATLLPGQQGAAVSGPISASTFPMLTPASQATVSLQPSSSLGPIPLPVQQPLLPNPHRSSNPIHQQPSYAQIARGSRGPGFVRSHASDVEAFARLPRTGINIICGSREGLPSFSFTNSDLPRVEKLYSNALVMKFHGGRPSLESSHKEISSWGMTKPFSIGPLSSRAFLLRFQDETDLLKVLTRPSTALINFPYKVFRWHSLCHIKEDSCIAPVWISLPRLPLQCFVPEFLEAVANKIGRFLCLDKATATLARPSAARLCVELDLRRPLPQFIWVGLFDGFKQAILYEKLPKFCNVCHIQGHSTVECFKAPSAVVCPQGHRETPATQTGAYGIPNHQRTPSVRQNASKQLTSLHQQPTSTTTTPFPHIPSIPPNPPPSSSQTLPTTLHPSPQAAVLPPPSQTSASISSSTTTAPNIDHFQIQPTSTLVQRAHTAAAASLTPPAHSPLIPPSAAAPSPSDALLQVQPTATLLQRDSAAAATSAAPSAGTQHQQTNIEVNKEIWEAVNRQVAILEQARLTVPTAAIKPSDKNQFSTAKSINIKPSDVGNSTSLSKKQAAALEQFKGKVLEQTRIRDRHLSNPTSMNHFQALRDDHSEADDEAMSYYSDTDEGCVEPIEMGYQSANGRSSSKPSALKTNKRHPNMPLHVRLRSRKSSYPSTP